MKVLAMLLESTWMSTRSLARWSNEMSLWYLRSVDIREMSVKERMGVSMAAPVQDAVDIKAVDHGAIFPYRDAKFLDLDVRVSVQVRVRLEVEVLGPDLGST